MERVEESEHHRDIYSHLDREADKTWVHHVADLDRGDEVHSETYDRPVAVLKHVESLTAMFSEHDFDPSLFWLPERACLPLAALIRRRRSRTSTPLGVAGR